jgi:hypothetical protein
MPIPYDPSGFLPTATWRGGRDPYVQGISLFAHTHTERERERERERDRRRYSCSSSVESFSIVIKSSFHLF